MSYHPRLIPLSLLALLNMGSVAQANPDILHYDLDITLDPDTLYLDGEAKLDVLAVDTGMDTLNLDFIGFEIESVTVDGIPVTFSRSETILTIELPAVMDLGAITQVAISYTGHPESYVTENGELGVLHDRDITFAVNVTEGARHWFPGRDMLQDKATTELRLNLPPGFTSAGPGHLESITPSGNLDTHRWVMDQEITPYLLSFAFSDRYVQQSLELPTEYGVETADILLLPGTVAGADIALSQVPLMVDWLTARYGAFPYDRVGLHEIPFPGAVEQPGNIAMGSFYFADDERLLVYFAHELSHTWFQGLVTTENWEDIWLSEGAAAWHELLWIEESNGLEAADIQASTYIDAYRVGMASEGIFPIGDPDLVFGYTTYMKGSTVFRLLEHLAGRDTLLQIFDTYFDDEDGIANLDDFFAIIDAQGLPELQNFRTEWIDRAGLPDYDFAWATAASEGQVGVVIEVDQGRGDLYTTPIDFWMTYADGHQEIITIRPSTTVHSEFLCLTEAPVDIQFDPRRMIPAGAPGQLERLTGDPALACTDDPGGEGCATRAPLRDLGGLLSALILLPLWRLGRRD